ncbi:hypothetical protein BH10CYA1_BH10CYA1_39870 [soil metagenome]
MFTRTKFRHVTKFKNAVLVGSVVAGLSFFAAAIASEPIPESVINIDLCTLAYQLYHQSLCLPLDPWYDNMSRVGSDRRDNICRFTHDYATKLGSSTATGSSDQGFYSGPSAARGWRDSNLKLDPVLTNYKHIDAKLPAFTRDGERFIAIFAPAYITQNIKSIDGFRYRTKPTSFPSTDVERFQIREYPSGEDHLIVFEGGTGIAGATESAWSPMGFVLMRKTPTGYDAHIVFRGSRSGAALATTVWNAQAALGDAKGNPDWITDLRSGKQIDQPLISKVGKVTQGFGEALPTMMGPITACCQYLSQKYPAPEHIYVTGHSLGAGLASQFVSALEQGSFGDDLRKQVKSWPWDNATLMAYAQPIPGDPTFAANFDKISPTSTHYWVEGDAVVEATSGTIVGMLIDKGEHVGVQKKLSNMTGCSDNPHEVFVIRDALVRDLQSSNASLSQQLAAENTWGYYESFSKMLAGQPLSYVYPGAPAPKIVTEENLRKMLQNYNFGPEFDRWLEQVYARMIADKSSYIGFKFQSTLDDRQKLVLDIVEHMRKPSSDDTAQDLESLANDFKSIDGNLGLTNEEHWIFGAMILSRLQKSNLTLKDLQSNSAINTSLESKVAN